METRESSSEWSVERVAVPGDNSCLFYAAGYLCEDAEASERLQKRLRQVVLEFARADPDRAMRELLLERSVEDYAAWIMNEFHEGGEQEIIALAAHYEVRLAVVSTESESILTYGDDSRKIGYLFYTGTHYDPLVGARGSIKQKLFEEADASFEKKCVEAAKLHKKSVLKRNASEVVYRLRCKGCGMRLVDNDAFQSHCSQVDHDETFSFECEEIFEVSNREESSDFAFACALAAKDASEGGPSSRTRAQRNMLLLIDDDDAGIGSTDQDTLDRLIP